MALRLIAVNFPLAEGSATPVYLLHDDVTSNNFEPIVPYDPSSGLAISITGGGLKVDASGVTLSTQAAGSYGTLQANGLQSANGSGSLDLSTLSLRDVLLFLNVAAASGSAGTLKVVVQSQDPASSNWADVANFADVSWDGTSILTANQVAVTQPLTLSLGPSASSVSLTGMLIRVRWEITGGTFTFSVGYAGK